MTVQGYLRLVRARREPREATLVATIAVGIEDERA
jgi:hypothetical protein